MDDLPEERERGVTIRAQIKEFDTRKYHFSISDAPGHQDFVQNMIKGTSQAEAAVLLVSANEGIKPQTKEHLTIAKTFGIDQLIIAINKMDVTNPPFSQETYNSVVNNLKTLLKNIGYSENQYTFVPVSAYLGENTVRASNKMNWYSGKSLIDSLDDLESKKAYNDLPLRWPIRDVMKVKGVGYIPVGHIASGRMKIGDELVFMPGNLHAEVRTMEKYGRSIEQAKTGDPVGVDLRVIGKWDKNKRNIRSGYVAGLKKDPPTVAETFNATVIILNHPSSIHVGYSPIIHTHEAHVKGIMETLDAKLDPKTLKVTEEFPSYISRGDVAKVTFRPLLPLVIESIERNPALSRFAIRDSNITIGAGIVNNVVEKKYTS